MPPLQHDMVALQAAGEVVPGCGDHGVLALQVADDLLVCSLLGCVRAAIFSSLESPL
jgi:hypothetical protein